MHRPLAAIFGSNHKQYRQANSWPFAGYALLVALICLFFAAREACRVTAQPSTQDCSLNTWKGDEEVSLMQTSRASSIQRQAAGSSRQMSSETQPSAQAEEHNEWQEGPLAAVVSSAERPVAGSHLRRRLDPNDAIVELAANVLREEVGRRGQATPPLADLLGMEWNGEQTSDQGTNLLDAGVAKAYSNVVGGISEFNSTESHPQAQRGTLNVVASSFGPPGALLVFFVDFIWQPLLNLLRSFVQGISALFGRTRDLFHGKGQKHKKGLLSSITTIIVAFWLFVFVLIGFISQVRLGWLYGLLLGGIFAVLHILLYPEALFPIAHGVYLLGIAIFAQCYRILLVYQYPQFRRPPTILQTRFTFGILDGFLCDPDMRICCTSCFCMPVRWADTASAARVDGDTWGTGSYWSKLLGVGVLFTFTVETYGASMFLALVWAVYARQKLRKMYGFASADCASLSEDFAVWLFCAPCATMQEAMQAEFVDLHIAERGDARSLQSPVER